MATSSVVRTSPDTCVITCPRCAQGNTLPIVQLRWGQELPHVRCGCGFMLRLVRMDQRRFPRKPVQLSGVLLNATTHTPLTTVSIIDLSLGGVRFVTPLSSFQVGERYRIVFSLDDALRTEIREDIVVRHVTDSQYFGAEFFHPECYDELDFYLTPWAIQC
ncbi:MAG: PilZ domain-containing protein [Candidatus Tectomicrobia bacterium]|nr:PilZ domain-containing protein [Candidatus Tectomicrobia bacterium]